jgi:hypothetical protein
MKNTNRISKNTINNKNYIYLLLILLTIIILITIVSIFYNKNKYIESFDNINNNYETGIGPKDSTGFIKFTKQFSKPPIVFTQIIGNGKLDNSYSIQIFNVNELGFQYIKNSLINSTTNDLTLLKMSQSNNEIFNWIAYDDISQKNTDNISKNKYSKLLEETK